MLQSSLTTSNHLFTSNNLLRPTISYVQPPLHLWNGSASYVIMACRAGEAPADSPAITPSTKELAHIHTILEPTGLIRLGGGWKETRRSHTHSLVSWSTNIGGFHLTRHISTITPSKNLIFGGSGCVCGRRYYCS